jgi:hypothetical protein
MSSRPQNIGIKAIEIYFPSQVCSAPNMRFSLRTIVAAQTC